MQKSILINAKQTFVKHQVEETEWHSDVTLFDGTIKELSLAN